MLIYYLFILQVRKYDLNILTQQQKQTASTIEIYTLHINSNMTAQNFFKTAFQEGLLVI